MGEEQADAIYAALRDEKLTGGNMRRFAVVLNANLNRHGYRTFSVQIRGEIGRGSLMKLLRDAGVPLDGVKIEPWAKGWTLR